MKREIYLIGMAVGWENAPMKGESWGATGVLLNRSVSRVIDMNDYTDDKWGKTCTRNNKRVMELCEAMGIPYIGLHNYPLKEIMDYFGVDFFTNTIDYMIALAIYEGVDVINFYGVNIAHQSRYAYESPGIHFWLGQAMGRGMEINVFGKNSMILRALDDKLYGYDVEQKSLEGR